MNLPNKLTLFRIILVPIMVIIPFLGIQGKFLGIPTAWLIIDFIFIIASITDKLDGYLARKNNQVTTFGKFFRSISRQNSSFSCNGNASRNGKTSSLDTNNSISKRIYSIRL